MNGKVWESLGIYSPRFMTKKGIKRWIWDWLFNSKIKVDLIDRANDSMEWRLKERFVASIPSRFHSCFFRTHSRKVRHQCSAWSDLTRSLAKTVSTMRSRPKWNDRHDTSTCSAFGECDATSHQRRRVSFERTEKTRRPRFVFAFALNYLINARRRVREDSRGIVILLRSFLFIEDWMRALH